MYHIFRAQGLRGQLNCFKRASHGVALLAALFFMCVALAVSVFAQGSGGRITGNIVDQSGAAVPGAKVTITDSDRGVARTLTSDGAGAYAAPSLTPGNYAVRYAAEIECRCP